MQIWDVLELIGGLCLFLFGMNLMGAYLEKSAGNGLKSLLGRLTTGKAAGFFTGLGVTSVIQSSSATTVMVVGFVNSGLLTLRQAINVIMGANVGTTVTAWLLSLSGIEDGAWYVKMFKPSSFTPILALIGILLYMGSKNNKKKDIGVILLGFATLMVGMDNMSAAVSGLNNDPSFASLLTMFTNPIMGVLAGAVLTGIIQSSSASVGILQALSSTGAVTIGMSIPIIMGQNIGTCVTALLSSVGANRNARRTSLVHLCFNVIGTIILLTVFCAAKALFDLPILNDSASEFTIAVCHTAFNLICTAILLPCAGLLEKLSFKLIPESEKSEKIKKDIEIDERLMATPSIAIDRCRILTGEMAEFTMDALKSAIEQLGGCSAEKAEEIHALETRADRYEDVIGSYLVKLNTYPLSDNDSHESSKYLRMLGDFERISDHAVNILESAEEMSVKEIKFTPEAQKEMDILTSAVVEITELTYRSYIENDLALAAKVEPLEQVIDKLKEKLRASHIDRLQKGCCSIEAGFIWSDLLNNLERVSDHCSNIASCIVEISHDSLDLHEYLHTMHHSEEYTQMYTEYANKYSLKRIKA